MVGLDANSVIKYIELVTLGIINAFRPAETLRLAITKGIMSLIIVHNHPSGNIEPSMEDKKMTEKLNDACKIMDIDFMDHIIISETSSYRYEKNNLIK